MTGASRDAGLLFCVERTSKRSPENFRFGRQPVGRRRHPNGLEFVKAAIEVPRHERPFRN